MPTVEELQQLRLANARAEQEKNRADEKDRSQRRTTLAEYLELCHTHFFQPISVQTDKAFATQWVNLKGKLFPNHLRPWDDFLLIQQNTQQRLKLAYKDSDERIFESSHFIEVLGQKMTSQKFSSEAGIVLLHTETIEYPVTAIIQHLQSIDSIQNEFNVRSGVLFDSNPNGLSDRGEEVSQRIQSSQSSTPHHSIPPTSGLRRDQTCVYTRENDDGTLRKLAFVVEYKAPHKLSLSSLHFSLREMDIKSVMSNPSVPTAKIKDENDQEIDNLEHFKYHADRLVASVIAQKFSYMIQSRVQYGYITTSKAFIFLHIQLDDPGTVYYHLIEPKIDVAVEMHANQEFVDRTAINQVLAFSLLAMESEPTSQIWCENAMSILNTWDVNYEAVLRTIPENVRKNPPPSSYRTKAYFPVDQFKMVPGNKKRSRSTRREPSTSCNETNTGPSYATVLEPPVTPSCRRTQPTNNEHPPQDRGNRFKNANVSQNDARN